MTKEALIRASELEREIAVLKYRVGLLDDKPAAHLLVGKAIDEYTLRDTTQLPISQQLSETISILVKAEMSNKLAELEKEFAEL